MKKTNVIIVTAFLVILTLNIALWTKHRTIKAKWMNVPDVPSKISLILPTLGDEQFAYRYHTLILQNMGDTGGNSTALKDYNYDKIEDWLTTLYNLDDKAAIIPYLASYYYGATPDNSQIHYIIDFLEKAGKGGQENDWRWLVQAVILAKHSQKDLSRALELSEELTKIYRPDMPEWILRMPAFITADMGDKETAYQLLVKILASGIDDFDPNEVFFLKEYICNEILDKEKREINPICMDINKR